MSTKNQKTASKNDESVVDFLQEIAGATESNGFGDMDSSTMAIPFLKLLQDLSPETKIKKPEYIEGAVPGMFINSVTKELYEEVNCVVLAFEHCFNEWTANRGPLIARHPKSAFGKLCINPQDFGKYKTAEGNDLVETYMYYLLIEGREEEGPVCFSATKSLITPCQGWNRLIKSLTFPNGKPAPEHFGKYTLSPIDKANDKGDYKSFKATRNEHDRYITRDQLAHVTTAIASLPSPEKVSHSLQLTEGGSSVSAGKHETTKY
jgi:hypothetical protein